MRLSFGLPVLDDHLGGGLLPGTLAVVAGATGAGKTQLGLHWAHEGLAAENHAGLVCDLTSRGDAQNHLAYAREQLDWELRSYPVDGALEPDHLWEDRPARDFYQPWMQSSRRVTRPDVDPEEWHAWKSDLARLLRRSVGFFYEGFTRGARRVVVDGIEPTERFADSIQFELFEYLYHKVLRQEDQWTARELLRERYREYEPRVLNARYDHTAIGCVFSYTTPSVMLEDLITQPIGSGDVFSNASTIILMGRIRDGRRLGRALYVAKHRGSACRDEILPYELTDRGPVFG